MQEAPDPVKMEGRRENFLCWELNIIKISFELLTTSLPRNLKLNFWVSCILECNRIQYRLNKERKL